MAVQMNRLNEAMVVSITKPGLHSDGGNLFLQVATVGGAKSWVFRYATKGKTKAPGLGPVHAVSLKDARKKATALRAMLTNGLDPATELAKVSSAAKSMLTFDQCAEQYITSQKAGWSNKKHIAQWTSTLATYASPVIGKLPVAAIETEHILKILTPIWTIKTETASRVRQRIESVLSWAKSKKLRTGDNPAAWKDNLEHLMPKPGSVMTVRHHPSLSWVRLPTFMQALKQQAGSAAQALQLLIICANRSIEVRGARWPEFDFEAMTWVIPAERMKAKVEHTIPLSDAAVELLNSLPRHEGSDLLFPSGKKTPLSDMTLTALIRRMNDVEGGPIWTDDKGVPVVVHGFRSTFRVWAAEATDFPRDVAEHALAHRLPDAVEAAYQRSTLFEKRRRMMAEWGTWTTSTPGANVVSLHRSEAA